jgi:hypothetical protein
MTAPGRAPVGPATRTPSAARQATAISAAGSHVAKQHAFAHRVRGSVSGGSRWRYRHAIGADVLRTAGDHHRDGHQAVTSPHRGTATRGRRF